MSFPVPGTQDDIAHDPAVAIAVPSPLRLPVFRAWWTALQLSNAGTWMQQVAAGWLVFQATNSAAAVGLLGLAQRGPSLFLTPLGGRLADRRDRRSVLAVTLAAQLVSAVGLTLAAAFTDADPWLLIALSAAGGIAQALQYPAQLATISTLVPASELHTAVSLNSAGFNLARVLGPAAAGVLLLLPHGAVCCFALNALSFALPLVVLRRLPAASAGARAGAATVRAGVAHALASPPLRRLIVGCAVFTFCAAPLTILAPAYAHVLGGGPDALGGLLAAFGAGALLGAAVVVPISRRIGRGRLIACAMAGYAVVGLVAALAPSPLLAALPCALAGACWLAVFTSTNASIQLITADHLRGRMLALYLWALVGPMAISGVIVGWIAGLTGTRAALAGLSLPLACYAVWSLARPVPGIDAAAPDPDEAGDDDPDDLAVLPALR
jgi:MFS family permease